MPDTRSSDFSSDTSRLTGISDGVFAFALTLLVINLKLPDAGQVAREGLTRGLMAQAPAFFIWVFSFSLIAIYWQVHRRLFVVLHGCDSGLIWLNFVFLLCISFLWYPAGVLGTYGQHQPAVVFYDICIMVVSLTSAVLLQYAAHDSRILDEQTAPLELRRARRRTLDTVGIAMLSILLSFKSVEAAEYCWLLLILVRVTGGRISRAQS